MPLYVFEMWGGVDSECGERVMSVVVKCGGEMWNFWKGEDGMGSWG